MNDKAHMKWLKIIDLFFSASNSERVIFVENADSKITFR